MKIQEEWSVNEGDNNGKPIFVRVNNWCSTIISKRVFVYRLGIAIKFKEKQMNGLLHRDEVGIFNLIEDDIFEIFQNKNFGVVSLIVTTNNMREFVLYLTSNNKVEEKILVLKKKYKEYEFQFYLEEDANWKLYNEFLL